MKNIKILHVEDNAGIADLVQTYMAMEGHEVILTLEQDEILGHVKQKNVDIVLLDYVLPQINGMEILKEIRKQSDIPVIFLSGKKKEAIDKILCIENGADDYIEKPFTPREVLARMQAILSRTSCNKSPKEDKISTISIFDIWTLDRDQYQAYDDNNRSAELTTKEFLLLEKMVASPNVAFERETLLGFLHDGNMEVFDRAVDINMTRIRKKLRDDPQDPKYIKTIRGVGYMFCCDVARR